MKGLCASPQRLALRNGWRSAVAAAAVRTKAGDAGRGRCAKAAGCASPT
jgi:hypothetical protein